MDHAPVPRAPTSIGDLPDDVLIKIMSYLTSREAVHTCLLAKYWRDLWCSVPSVNVSIQEFDGQRRSNDVPMEELEGQDEGEDEDVQELEEEDGEDDDDMSVDDDNMSVEDDEDGEDDEDDEDDENDEDDEDEVVFKRFVNTLLKLRNPVDLNEFRLMYSVSSGTENRRNYRDANRWIAYALQCNAPSVKVANRVHALRLAPNVFSSRSLKRLHIGSAILPPGFFNQLQVGCPSLEYLFLHDCTIGDLEIFSSRLKILILSDEVYFPFDEGSQTCISAPSLISLNIDHGLSGDRLPVLTTMPSLKSASVSLSGGNIVTRDADSLRKFLGGLSHVTSLDFCYWDANLTMEKGFRWCPTFSKLINLTLDCSFVNGNFYGLIVILQNTPNLRRLTLNVGQSNTSVAGELEHESFTCGQLEIVEIICWGRDEMFNRVTMFLLEHGISDGKIHVTDRRNV